MLDEIRNSEHPPRCGSDQFKEKVTLIFLENQKGLHLHHLKTHIRMPVKQESNFGPCQETSYTTITLNPESNFYSPREESFPIPLKHIDVSRTTLRTWMFCKRAASMTFGTSMDQEICLFLGQVSLSLLLSEKPPEEFLWSGWRLTKRQPTSRPDHFMARTLERTGKKCQVVGEA